MSKYTVGQKIWKIDIDKYKDEPSYYSYRKSGIKVENLEILGISNYKIVLNNEWFTTGFKDDINFAGKNGNK